MPAMANISIQKPTDQPTGAYRLMNELRLNLESNDFHTFRIIVAFAKAGPLLRLDDLVKRWKSAGKNIQAIIGIDQKGTSQQALEYAIVNFDLAYIAHVPGNFSPTFHPKVYLFVGKEKALAYIGSNNLTVGGTETNLETHIKLEINLPSDKILLENILSIWDDALKISTQLDNELLSQLVESGLVLSEKQMRQSRSDIAQQVKSQSNEENEIPTQTFPILPIRPPSPLPKVSKPRKIEPKSTENLKDEISEPFHLPSETFVIQIKPHHNGEIFLSKIAVNQNPDFFGYPFTGLTTPKKSTNRAYPQRIPDPIVNLVVYDTNGKSVLHFRDFELNTVYYEQKAEIRITVPQEVVSSTPEFSIMVMRQTPPDKSYDYDIDIYPPQSYQYNEYLEVCNQPMPSGGNATARRFGWL